MTPKSYIKYLKKNVKVGDLFVYYSELRNKKVVGLVIEVGDCELRVKWPDYCNYISFEHFAMYERCFKYIPG